MKKKTLSILAVVISSAFLLAGCQSANTDNSTPANNQNNQMQGPNGSVGPNNPFGVGTGSGLTPAH